MKTDFSINVQVNLGVTPELVAMVSAILAHRPQKLEGALATQEAQLENAPEEQPPTPKEEAAASQAPTTKRGRKKKDPEPPQQEQEAEPRPQTKEKPGSEEEEAAANQAEANADGSEQQPEEQPQPKAKQEEAAKPLTEEDVRAAMHRTRQRIEGEDYRDNVKGELYQKYHKPLTAQFKNMAALLGSDKPSALPEDKRATFIKQCDELKIMKDGTIGTDCPF